MKISGHHTMDLPVQAVWDALLDPRVLVATIPGCELLLSTGEHTYDMTVTAGVAAIKGTYDGTCTLSDLVPHESMVMSLRGAGAPGTIDATVQVWFSGAPDGVTTKVSYEADAAVGGMVGGVGQRLLTSVSKRMADEFFDNVQDVLLAGGPAPEPEAGPDSVIRRGEESPGRLFTPPRAAAHGHDDFLKGVAVGAGLVLLGVVAGSLIPSRRARR